MIDRNFVAMRQRPSEIGQPLSPVIVQTLATQSGGQRHAKKGRLFFKKDGRGTSYPCDELVTMEAVGGAMSIALTFAKFR
jgi:hypothetical protein